MRYFLDTEFIEDGRTIDLISIALVREDGDYLYRVSSEFDESRCDDWLRANVLPRIAGHQRVSRSTIRDGVLGFISNDTPEIWAYYADYDWVAFCQLFGRMLDLPKGYPMYCRDLKQVADDRGVKLSDVVPQENEHSALDDARWTKRAYEWLHTNRR